MTIEIIGAAGSPTNDLSGTGRAFSLFELIDEIDQIGRSRPSGRGGANGNRRGDGDAQMGFFFFPVPVPPMKIRVCALASRKAPESEFRELGPSSTGVSAKTKLIEVLEDRELWPPAMR